jgi:hypothetical protein
MSLTAQEQREQNGYQPGVSGNPNGRKAIKLRADALYAEIRPEFGALDKVDETLLQHACALLAHSQMAKRDDQIRSVGTAHRVLESLRKRARAVPKASGDLNEYLLSKKHDSEMASKGAGETEE